MSDKPEPTSGTESPEDTIFNSDIGDDWGAAFQAEDFMFSPDEEASSEFFLEDDSFDDTPDEKVAAPIDAEGAKKKFTKIPRITTCTALLASILSLPTKYKIPAIALPVVLLTAVLFSLQDPPEQIAEEESRTDIAQTEERLDSPITNEQTKSEESKNEELEQLAQIADIPEKVRKRWQFPSFIISSYNDEIKTTALLSVDLTFVLLLDEDEPLPKDNELLVRETIYQFFTNQPFSELQRFTLSRGEMNNGLRSWVNKQLPDIPLSSIVFKRYQIL